MEMHEIAELEPTWKFIEFDEGIENIPCVSKGYWEKNPLDRDVAILFEPVLRDHVYYLPRTGETIVTERYLYSEQRLSEAFGVCVKGFCQIREKERAVRSFVSEMVIGEVLVYRCFEMTAECKKNGENEYTVTVSPAKEVSRILFHDNDIFQEWPDHKTTTVTVDQILFDGIYDTLQDADAGFALSLYQDFVHKVEISHKSEIFQALTHVKKNYPKMGLEAFLEIYRKANERKPISEDTPERIVRELYGRSHLPYTAVRIEKDLIVVTGERECRCLDLREQIRGYFDLEGAYYFIRNAVNGEWEKDDLRGQLTKSTDIRYRNIDRDVFDNTCVEQYIDFSVNKGIPTGSKVSLGSILAQVGFLSAEQAAKIDSPVYQVLLRNIYEGKILDGEKTLSEVLGITGAQVKFLQDIQIPENLERFGACMEAEDFKEYFPDVKKRIFAVSFYLNGINLLNGKEDLTKEEIFLAAQTLNSLEKSDDEKRDRLLMEYRDYLRMYRTYHRYVENMREDDPLRQEITDFGEIPVNMKPSRIRDYHNKLGQIVDIINCSDQIVEYTAAIEERYEKEARDIEYTNRKYSILMPKNAMEIIREGRELDHCVGRAGYIEAMAAEMCMILFLRDSKDPDTPLLTIEVRDDSIRQCYGFGDSYNHDEEIRDFVKEYASLHNWNIDAVIYMP